MNLAEKVGNLIRKCIVGMFAAVFVLVLGMVLLGDQRVEYPEWARNQSLMPNIVLAVTVAALTALGFFVWKKRLSGISFLQKPHKCVFYVVLWGMSALLLALQVFLSYHLYFVAAWDVSVVTGVADWIWLGVGSIGEHFYFSQYTNNVAIVYVLAVISRISEEIGLKVTHYLVLVLADCVMINLAGVLTALSVKRLTGNARVGIFSFLLFFGLIGINPWMVVPYTDTYSILFPVLTFYLYLAAKQTDRIVVECALWALLGLMGLFGYFIKPSAVIVLIAVLCYELVLFMAGKGRWKAALHVCLFLVAVAVSGGMWQHMLDYTGSNLDENLKFSYTHYLMLGLNEENVGAYNADDYAFSSRQPDQETRTRENLRVVKERLGEYGVTGYLEFMLKKLLVNYNDGTFAWEKEGEFELSPSYNEETPVQVALRRLFRSEADRFVYYATFAQWLWILVLMAVPAAGIRQRGKGFGDGEYVAFISMIGSFLFVMLFEARARYLYNMTPIFILCAAIGVWKLYGLYVSGTWCKGRKGLKSSPDYGGKPEDH